MISHKKGRRITIGKGTYQAYVYADVTVLRREKCYDWTRAQVS
jgi:hypothetical protein